MTRDVTIYIKELLFGHDCVIVPGFGAFIGNYSPARIDHAEGLFYPPVKRITFNRHLINNDGLLIGHISSRECIGYGEARDLATSFADELRKRIGSGERVMVDNIGTFFNNREGVLIFEPDADANYLLSSYGLTSFHRTPVKDFDIRRKVLEHHEKVPGKTTSMRRMLTRAAVIIPLLVAMALIPFRSELFNGKVQETNMNPLAIAELEYNRSQILNVAPSTDTSKETVSTETKTSDLPVAAEVVPQTIVDNGVAIPIDEAEIKYILVTGSFQSEENALSMVRNLQAKGFSPDVAAGPNGFFRVCAGTYNTSEEANTFLRKMKSTYPGSWVCKTK
jgi:cell division septation protein DedD